MMGKLFFLEKQRFRTPSIFRIALAATILSISGCEATMSDNPLVKKLIQVMDNNMPPYDEGYTQDITEQVCPLVDAPSLDEIVGIKIGDHEIWSSIITGDAEIEPNSRMWSMTRSKPFQWSQEIIVIIEPNGKCLASVYFR